jgi:hypothetical protein
MNWIFLSKYGTDRYINALAMGSGAKPTVLEQWDYDHGVDPVVIRGIMKHKIIKRCWADGRRFRYMDSGYFGNKITGSNPNGWKFWHRIVDNDLQHGAVQSRPADRWRRLRIDLQPRRHGSKIMLVPPDEKPCVFYGIDLGAWIDDTIRVIQQHTDREIIFRERVASRRARVANTVETALTDVHAVVTYNSIAATESIITGVPAFVLAPANAAAPVANRDLATIDDPWWPTDDQRHAWACHLAYGQFHIEEMANGTAARILEENKELKNA